MNTKTQTPNQTPNTIETIIDVDAFLAGNDVQEQQLEQTGFRRIQHFNESPYHRGTVIAQGGYGIKDEDESAPDIGKRETVKHLGGNSSIMRCAQQIEIALIGFSPRYFTVEYDDPADSTNRVRLIVSRYISPDQLPGANGRCRSAMSYFVALKAEEKRQLWELTFKGFNVEDAVRVVGQAKYFAQQAAKYIREKTNKIVTPHTFMLWLPLGVGESRMVGKDEQSPVTPPVLKLAADADVSKFFVSGDDFCTFLELRKQLDEYLATGRYNGASPQQLVALPAPRALPASNGNGNGMPDDDIPF